MSSPSILSSLGDWTKWTPLSLTIQPMPYLLAAFLFFVVAYTASSSDSSLRNVPIINPTKRFALSYNVEVKKTFVTSCKDLLAQARSLWPKRPFRMTTDLGEVIVLPPELADEIRNEPNLSFASAVYRDFHGNIPGFEPTALGGNDDQLLQIVARKQLTKTLAKVSEPLSEEATSAFSLSFGESPEWHEVLVKQALMDVVARLSSRVFLGDLLCRDEAWLRITKEYTINLFIAATKLRMYPRFLRRYVHWFVPECTNLRAQFAESRRLVMPVIEQRREARRAARAAGKPIPQFDDALDWAEQEASATGATYDPANFQLILSAAAIHTTTDLLDQVVIDLAQNPKYLPRLREEVTQVLRAEGWKKTSLYNMKLLDSVIKESQRMKPIGFVSMRRRVEGTIRLSNGLVLKEGMRTQVDSYRMKDPEMHENPEQWIGDRFLKLRSQPGKENKAQLSATGPDHIAFGHGEHACPGRFFSANELKIALCHMLIKYDWKLAPGTDVTPVPNGTQNNANSSTRILIRRRQDMEIDIDSL